MARERKSTLRSFLDSLLAIFDRSETFHQAGDVILTIADRVNTVLRNIEVYVGAFFRDSKNGASLQHTDANPTHAARIADGSLTNIGYIFTALVFTTPIIGLVQIIYQNKHKKDLNALSYLVDCIKEMLEKQNIFLAEDSVMDFINNEIQTIINDINSDETFDTELLKNAIISQGNFNEILKHQVANQNGRSSQVTVSGFINNDYQLNSMNDRADLVEDDLQPVVKPRKENIILRKMNQLANSRLGNAVSYPWTFFIGSAFVFWLGWSLAASIVGTAVAGTAVVLAPVIATTFVLCGAVAIWKKYNASQEEAVKNIKIGQIQAMLDNNALANDAKNTLMHKRVHDIDKRLKSNKDILLNDKVYKSEKYKNLNGSSEKATFIYEILSKMEEEDSKRLTNIAMRVKQGLFMKKEHDELKGPSSNANARQPSNKYTVDLKASKKLERRMHGSKAEHNLLAAFTMAKGFITGIIIPAFFVWLSGSILTALTLPGLFSSSHPVITAIQGFIGANTPVIVHTAGGILASLLGLKALAAVRKQQAEHKDNVDKKLGEKYEDSNLKKSDVFTHLEAKMEYYKNQVKSQGANSSYDVSKIDVYNDYYFEKQKYQPGVFSYFKKGLNRFMAGFGGVGSGFTLMRFIGFAPFAAAGLLALSPLGAPLAVLITAAAIGVVYGVVCAVKYHLDKKQEHRQHFADNIDDRIQYMEYRIQEMQAVCGERPETRQEMLTEISNHGSSTVQARLSTTARVAEVTGDSSITPPRSSAVDVLSKGASGRHGQEVGSRKDSLAAMSLLAATPLRSGAAPAADDFSLGNSY